MNTSGKRIISVTILSALIATSALVSQTTKAQPSRASLLAQGGIAFGLAGWLLFVKGPSDQAKKDYDQAKWIYNSYTNSGCTIAHVEAGLENCLTSELAHDLKHNPIAASNKMKGFAEAGILIDSTSVQVKSKSEMLRIELGAKYDTVVDAVSKRQPPADINWIAVMGPASKQFLADYSAQYSTK